MTFQGGGLPFLCFFFPAQTHYQYSLFVSYSDWEGCIYILVSCCAMWELELNKVSRASDGLWPDYNDGTWPACCSGSQFDKKEVYC